ncbi:MAG: hypothetical protein AABW92_04990 [Nanoarchaeota archaeon]
MEHYQESREKAIKHMKVADHILIMTYPLVQDPKLLKLVFKNIYLSIENLLLSLVHYESKYFKIPKFDGDFHSLLDLVKPVMKKYNISVGYSNFLDELNHVMKTQRDADVEFIRKDKFVFASEDYKLNIVSQQKLKDYIVKGKLLTREVLKVIK